MILKAILLGLVAMLGHTNLHSAAFSRRHK